MKRVALAITFAIGPWPSFQPSERVVLGSNGNRFSLSRGRVALLGIAQRSIRVNFQQKKSPFSPHNLLPSSVKTIGDWIKAKRIGKKLTPGHLALKMGIAHKLICSWEDGASQPNNEQIRDLIKIFGEAPLLGIVS